MADHPRSRGVYFHPRSHLARFAGSSPLARGLRLRECLHRQVARIIPARAGFTASNSVSAARSPDHPRSRGVYKVTRSPGCTSHGSSPLARGLLCGTADEWGPVGIIPARAGFTLLESQLDIVTRGSSPLARGLLTSLLHDEVVIGIIPARAGFTRGHITGRHWSRDHPRSRGVYRRFLVVWLILVGSSPLARGLRGDRCSGARGAGIIPARAGFTRRQTKRRAIPRDHPRSRGVYRGC